MRYLIFSLTALFLMACADPDNPVVYTALAGKAVDESEEVKQPPAPNHGSYEEVPYVPADPPETAAHTIADPTEENPDANIHTQSEIDAHRTDPLPAPGPDDWYKEAWDAGSENLQKQYREQQLREAGVLPTVSVSGCGIDTSDPPDGFNDVARFTFSRNGPRTEVLSVQYRAYSITGNRIWRYGKWNSEQFQEGGMSGFSAGNATFTSEHNIGNGTDYTPKVVVRIAAGWQSSMSGDYNVGTSEATVTRTSSACP